jgi:hypothetical protein
MARRIGGQYFPGAGEKRQTARRARMKYAETVQRQALAGPGGYLGGQALSQANRVGRRLLGSPGAGGYNLAVGGGAGGGGGGGGYGSDYDEARAANLARYYEGKGELTDLRKRGLGAYGSLGAQQDADINQQYDSQASQVQQGMVNRGLTASTIGPSMQLGVERGRAGALSRAGDARLRDQLAFDERITGNVAGFIERREDPYPDLGQYLSVAQQYGASGGGSPAVYGGYQVPGGGYFNVGGGSGQPQRPRPGPGFIAEGPQPGGGGGPGANPDVVQQPGGWGGIANVWDPQEKQRLADFQRKFGHLSVEQLKINPEAQRFIAEQRRKFTAGGPVTRSYMA